MKTIKNGLIWIILILAASCYHEEDQTASNERALERSQYVLQSTQSDYSLYLDDYNSSSVPLPMILGSSVDLSTVGAITYYLKDKNIDDITADNLLAVSVYQMESSQLMHRFFWANNGKLKEQIAWRGETTALSINDVAYLFEEVVGIDSPENTLYVRILNPLFLERSKDGFNEWAILRAQSRIGVKYYKASNGYAFRTAEDDEEDGPYRYTEVCRQPCEEIAIFEASCDVFFNKDGKRVEECSSGCVIGTLAQNEDDDFEGTLLLSEENLKKLYVFRDDFLVNSPFGRKYIEYYYSIGKNMINDLSLEMKMKSLVILPWAFKMVETVIDDDRSAVLITAEMQDALLEYIGFLEEHMNNDSAGAIFADVRDDLSHLTGLTLEEVYQLFE